MRRARLALVSSVFATAALAQSEALITTVSTPRVAIQSNFTGADIVVFGGIRPGGGPEVPWPL